MRRLALAIGVSMGLAVAPTPALAEQFVAENQLDFTVFVGCGNMFRTLSSGWDTAVFECSQGITFQMFAGIDDTAREHDHYCSDPTPVQRIRVEHRLAPSTNWAFQYSCEAAPW